MRKINNYQLAACVYVITIIFCILFCCITIARSQNIIRKGNTFVQIADSSSKIKKDTPTMTKYFYMTPDGTKYPVYVSSKGKYFIIKTSQKTGKQYRMYLPQITKQLQNEN